MVEKVKNCIRSVKGKTIKLVVVCSIMLNYRLENVGDESLTSNSINCSCYEKFYVNSLDLCNYSDVSETERGGSCKVFFCI